MRARSKAATGFPRAHSSVAIAAKRAETAEELVRKLVQTVGKDTEAREPDGSAPLLRLANDGSQYALFRWRSEPDCRLSPRETEIVRLVSEGLPNKCISAILEISTWTVATHLRRVYAKLGVNSRAAMVAKLSELRLRGTA